MHHFWGEIPPENQWFKSSSWKLQCLFGTKVCFKEGFCRSYPIISRDHDWSLKAPKTKKKTTNGHRGYQGSPFLLQKRVVFCPLTVGMACCMLRQMLLHCDKLQWKPGSWWLKFIRFFLTQETDRIINWLQAAIKKITSSNWNTALKPLGSHLWKTCLLWC